MKNKLFLFDKKLRKKFCLSSSEYICGVDEVGRGCIAGPLVSVAVVFSEKVYISDLKESKSISPEKREKLFIEITSLAEEVTTSIVPTYVINKIGLKETNNLVLKNAVEKLTTKVSLVIVDGYKISGLSLPQYSIFKADEQSAVVAAASVVAKVIRDRIMCLYHYCYTPYYKFIENKGYPTQYHRWKIEQVGLCELHRNYAYKFVNTKK